MRTKRIQNAHNEKIIRHAYQVAEDKDVAGWIAAFTEDGTFTDESIPCTYRGPDELGTTVEVYAKAFPDMHRELLQFYVTGNMVIVQLRLQGTHLGPLELPSGTVPRPASEWTRHAATCQSSLTARSSGSTATPRAPSSPSSSAWPESAANRARGSGGEPRTTRPDPSGPWSLGPRAGDAWRV